MLSEPMLVARLEQVQLVEQSIAWLKDFIENGDWDASNGELAHHQAQLKELERILENQSDFVTSVW